MTHRSLILIVGLPFLLFLTSCGDDGGAPSGPPPRRDGGVGAPDASGPPSVPPAISQCTPGAPIQIGELDASSTLLADRAHIIPRPRTDNEFLVATAQRYCPAPDGKCDGAEFDGPEYWAKRRVLLYAVGGRESDVPSGPYMVNLGINHGSVYESESYEPRIAATGDNLIVAWLDTVGVEPRNIWAAAVSPQSLSPLGGQRRISNVEGDEDQSAAMWASARKLHLVEDQNGAEVVFEVLARDTPSPSISRARISAASGERVGTVQDLGAIPHSEGPHGAIRSSSGTIIFGRTERIEGGAECSYMLGALGETPEKVEESSRNGPCSDFALAEGGTVYLVDNGSSLRFRPLGAAGAPIGRERSLVDAQRGSRLASPAIAGFANGFFIVYVEKTGESEYLRGLIIDAQGHVVSEEAVLDEGREGIKTPAIAVARGGSTIAIVWKDRAGTPAQQRTALLRLQCE